MTFQYSYEFYINQWLFQENLNLRRQLNTAIIYNNNLQSELDKLQSIQKKLNAYQRWKVAKQFRKQEKLEKKRPKYIGEDWGEPN